MPSLTQLPLNNSTIHAIREATKTHGNTRLLKYKSAPKTPLMDRSSIHNMTRDPVTTLIKSRFNPSLAPPRPSTIYPATNLGIRTPKRFLNGNKLEARDKPKVSQFKKCHRSSRDVGRAMGKLRSFRLKLQDALQNNDKFKPKRGPTTKETLLNGLGPMDRWGRLRARKNVVMTARHVKSEEEMEEYREMFLMVGESPLRQVCAVDDQEQEQEQGVMDPACREVVADVWRKMMA